MKFFIPYIALALGLMIGNTLQCLGQPHYEIAQSQYDSIAQSPVSGRADAFMEFSREFDDFFPELGLKAAQQAKVLVSKSNDPKLIMKALLRLANASKNANQRDSSIHAGLELLEISRRYDDIEYELHALESLFANYKRLRMDEHLTDIAVQIRQMLDKNVSDELKLTIYLKLNNYNNYMGKGEKRGLYLDSAAQFLNANTNPDLYSNYLNDRANYLASMGDTADALQTYIRIIESEFESYAKDEAFHNAILLYLWTGKKAKADSLARIAVNWALASNHLPTIIGAYYDLSTVLGENEDYKEALETYEIMDIYDDSLFNSQMANAVAEAQTKYEVAKREAAVLVSKSQRNLFIALSILLFAVGIAIVVVYTNRIRTNRLISEEQIARLEKEKEVLSLQSMLFAQEEERQRIARDLHDSIGALLSTAKLHISNIENELKKLSDLDFLKNTEEIIDRAGKEVRRVAHDMMPGVLMKLGLLEGIEDFFDRVRESNGIKVSFTYDTPDERLENKFEVMIYRIVQELVNNTLKHANAEEIKLMIKRNKEDITIDYRDDGSGFDPRQLRNESNFGLSSILSRVKFLNGQLSLDSSHKEGVHFVISIPISLS